MLVKVQDAKQAVEAGIAQAEKELAECKAAERRSLGFVSYATTITGWEKALGMYEEARKALSIAAGETIEVDAGSTIYRAMMAGA